MMRPSDRRGFSMVEMMTVLVIFGLVLAAAIPSVSHYMRRDRVRIAAENFRSACMVAQKRAMATRTEHRVVYDPTGGSYQVERRDGATWEPAAADPLVLPGGLEMDGGTTTDPSHHIVTFEALGTVKVDDVPARVQFFNGTQDTSTVSIVRTGRMTISHS